MGTVQYAAQPAVLRTDNYVPSFVLVYNMLPLISKDVKGDSVTAVEEKLVCCD